MAIGNIGLTPLRQGDAPAKAGTARQMLQALMSPWSDRLIAIIACMPFIAVIAARVREGSFDLPRLVLVVQMLLQILPMFVRRQPRRVTVNPWYWLLAFVATYWPFISVGLVHPGQALAGRLVTDGLSLLSLAVAAWARLSLGRNIGFVPAQRELVMRGAYRYMRHPIYTSIFITYLAFILSSYSPLNALQAGLGCFWFVIKSMVEERFLGADPAYRGYMQRVRWRWLPGLA
jgi:protein-S-isoprenylcysteine O-methyltransferase Ste14